MVWILLIAAIAAEVTATSFLKLSDGLSKLVPTAVVAIGYLASFLLLAQALKQLQVSVAYAIWSGVGTAAVALIGMLFMKEPATTAKVLGILLIMGGVATLHLAGAR